VEGPDPRRREGLAALLRQYGVTPKHRLGQHFLVDPAVFAAIGELADRGPGPCLEIGPGPGGLTRTLVERGHPVVAVELDSVLAALLRKTVGSGNEAALTVVHGDALTMSWRAVVAEAALKEPVTVVGNLPYYITGPLLGKLWEDTLDWQRAIFMVQREVAERIAAEPGARAAGVQSVLVRYVGQPALRRIVSPDAFVPPPDVESAVVEVVRRESPPVSLDALAWWVRQGFAYRRKMLRQALALAPGSPWGKREWGTHLGRLGIDGDRRAESLTMEEWVRLAASLDMAPQGPRWPGRDTGKG
jgi:16S rRNA (adenine1518-N6/adenine1519-N6)-dimethyltransferase